MRNQTSLRPPGPRALISAGATPAALPPPGPLLLLSRVLSTVHRIFVPNGCPAGQECVLTHFRGSEHKAGVSRQPTRLALFWGLLSPHSPLALQLLPRGTVCTVHSSNPPWEGLASACAQAQLSASSSPHQAFHGISFLAPLRLSDTFIIKSSFKKKNSFAPGAGTHLCKGTGTEYFSLMGHVVSVTSTQC